jgi:hypothetical protein
LIECIGFAEPLRVPKQHNWLIQAAISCNGMRIRGSQLLQVNVCHREKHKP